MELRPGDGIGHFALGSMLINALNLIKLRYPDSKASFAWDDSSPGRSTIYLTLSHPPLQLLFSPSQRLIRIQLAQASDTVHRAEVGEAVVYRGKTLKREEGESILKVLRKVMGPTIQPITRAPALPTTTLKRSGKAANSPRTVEKEEDDEETSCYPGITFRGLSLGDDRDSKLLRIILTPLPSTRSIEEAWLHPELPEKMPIFHGDLKSVEVVLDDSHRPRSTTLRFYTTDLESSGLVLIVKETTTEDITSFLGSAVRSFWKQDDRMSIHSSLASDGKNAPNPYFMSYPHLALTLLIHPTLHILLKIILHSNLPGEVNFGRNSRSPWTILSSTGESRSNMDSFVEIKELLGDGDEGTMILDRGVDGGEGIKGERGLTTIHGFPGVAFEVTRANDVETVWIF